MPDELPSRVARLEQRVQDLNERVLGLSPLATYVAQLAERIDTLRATTERLRVESEDFREKIDERDEVTRRDRKTVARWAIGLTVTIIAALIGALAIILSAGAHP